jgi:Fur family transcriptional regulator, ferric uptake regulator
MTGLVTDLEAALRAHGHRLTAPRQAVWEALTGMDHDGGHVTVDELTARVRARGSDADRASVYRTLALFEELGLARTSRLGTGDALHWERAHPDEHFHLLCTGCGEVDHHVGDLVAGVVHHLADDHGFEVRSVSLTVRGLCDRCRGSSARAE